MPAKYPHMKAGEVAIWERFIEEVGLPAGDITYDLHLGDGAPVDPSWPDWMGPMVKHLSQHRCDVVVETPWSSVIIEIKQVAGMSALGQLLGYEALYAVEMGGGREVTLMCVCETAEADVETAFEFYGIELVELGRMT